MSDVLFVCIGSRQHGMGHVTRDLVLAAELVRRGVDVEFLTVLGTPGAPWLAERGYYVRLETSEATLARAFEDAEQETVILDLEQGPSLSLLKAAREHFQHVVNIGCIGFYPTEDMVVVDALTDLQVFGVELFDPPRTAHELAGPDYLIVDPAYRQIQADPDGHILVTLGGADPHNLSPVAAKALTGLGRRVKVVIGPAAGVDVSSGPDVEVIRSPESLLPLFEGAALCVTATGTTAYESLCAGVPVILTNWSMDHMRTAKELARRGVAYNTGLWSGFAPEYIRWAVSDLLQDAEWRVKASYLGTQLVDGRGAARVAEAICKVIQGQFLPSATD